MLQCNGLVAIPSQPKLDFVPWNGQGFFANFNVVSQEPRKDHHKVHYYQVSMFVPKDKRAYWEERLLPGEVFLIRTGDFSSLKPEGYIHPLAQIKTTEKNFLHLKQAQWHTA